MILTEIISHQNRKQQGSSPSQIHRLSTAVAKYVIDVGTTSASDKRTIKRFTSQFQYTGPMFRTVFVWDEGDINDEQSLKQHIIQNEHTVRLSSWSKTHEGMDMWNPGIPDEMGDQYQTGNERRVLEVVCVQKGTGFDVEVFNAYLDQQNISVDSNTKHSIKRSAKIKEVIAPLSDHFDVEVVEEQPIDLSDVDRAEIRAEYAEMQKIASRATYVDKLAPQ